MPQLLERPDGRLAYDVAGSGPPLFLLTGLGGSRHYWANLLPALAREFTVITHDHMGTGDSSGQRIDHTVEALVADVVALMDHLGLRQASFAGHSTGAAMGQMLAQDHPQRVSKLVLSAGWAGPDRFFALCFEARKNLLKRAGLVAYQRATALFLYPPSWIVADTARLDALLAGFVATSPTAEVLAARIDMIVAFDRRARLQEVAAPTLVVCAADDQLTPMHLSEELAAGIAGARLVRMPWGGHASSQTAPEQFIDTVLEFLRS